MKLKVRKPLFYLTCRLPIYKHSYKYEVMGRSYQKAINRRRYLEGTRIDFIHN